MADWIKENNSGSVDESVILTEAKAKILDGTYKYVAFTNKKISGGEYINGSFTPEITDVSRLLELRVFNLEREFKAVRTQIGKAFKWRIAEEAGVDDEFYLFETQLLDIDRDKMKGQDFGGEFISMGGGKYSIPAEPDCDSVELVNYIKFDDYGNMQFVDFRIKRFFNSQKGGAENA